MLIDSFTFLNEYEILESRFEYLDDIVDFFVIVEANYTYNLSPKRLNFADNIHRFQKYLPKILYFPYAVDVTSDYSQNPSSQLMTQQWFTEYEQRNQIARSVNLFPDDSIIMIGDVDEVPNKNAIKNNIHNVNSQSSFAFTQHLFYNNFDYLQTDDWNGTVITTIGQLRQRSPQQFRDMRNILPRIPDGGWHLSFWSTVENIKYKIENFSHQEFNNPHYTDEEKIKARLAAGVDFFDRGYYTKYDHSLIQRDFYDIVTKNFDNIRNN